MAKRTTDLGRPTLLKDTTRNLPCALTQDELIAAGEQLAEVQEDIQNEDARAADVKASLKSTMTELESKRARLASTVRRREEYRDVAVELWLHEDGMVHAVRRDTGEGLEVRPMTDQERQQSLKLEPAS